ncbi:MAG: hypothetical protein HY901_00030 [Deltaproteobacteria bacterium]|nr:hypothetical protein [Deltaproteobacteria bacterium]
MRTGRLGSALALGTLFYVGCFTAVGEPDYWDPRRQGYLHPDGGGAFGPGGTGCPAVECSSYGDMESLDAVLEKLRGVPWPVIDKTTSVCLPASGDIPVTRTVSLRATDLELPAQCAPAGSCTGLTFKLSEGARGVTCLDHFCTALMLNSARFRVRLLVRDQYPTNPRYVPVVEVLPPCEAGCAQDEVTCGANHTCWPDLTEHCRFCLALPKEECACAGREESEACRVFESNSQSCAGKCIEGACEIAGGQPGCPSL